MFFDDVDLGPKKKKTILRVPPPTPETGWRPPTEFPNLSAATVIAFDTEAKENDWEHGPGWSRGQTELVGLSIAARDAHGNAGKWYFPFGHVVEPQYNLQREHVLGWAKSVLETNVPKVGANLIIDIGNLKEAGIEVKGQCHDVQFAEAILDSDGLVNLDYLGVKYLDQGKESNRLYEWCASAYGGKPDGFQRENIWRASPRLVGPYAEDDADMPIRILQRQWPLLDAQQVHPVYTMECGLIPLLVQMRWEGVSVDLGLAEKLYHELAIDIGNLYSELYKLAPVRIESVGSGRQIARVFDHVGLKYNLTNDGNPSFRKDFLKNLEHPVATKINEIREAEKVRSTFLRSYILEGHYQGKIHCQFHPLRNDDGGAKTGRFSSSDPNLQNIPVRSALGKKIRKIFIPDSGHFCWEKDDYSQIEYRDLAHFAVGPGSDELRAKYNADPNTDYHKSTQDNVLALTGRTIDRRPIKNMNFGLVYGMQEGKLITQNGFNPQEGREIFKAYHAGNPYVKPTMEAAAREMQTLGYITTVLGRRIQFNYWEPIDRDFDKPRQPGLPYELALRRYGSRIKRSGGHKAINYRLQGSAAEQIKAGMCQCWVQGIFDVTGVPRIQVHDELGFSVRDSNPATNEAFTEMRRVLESSIKLRIPVRVDHKRGPTWGECED